MLDYLVDESGTVKGLYYVPEGIGGDGKTYYAPNLEGFNGLTTQAAYYSQDDKETLEVSISLHMATSLDWGAVAYLAQSRYGANSSNVTKNTTGNQTGVMNLDSYTQTATI